MLDSGSNVRSARGARERRAWRLVIAISLAARTVFAAGGPLVTIEEFPVPEARQGIAVDATHFYAVSNRSIAKYTKDGKKVATWESPPDGPILHLDSGVVIGGKIYCAHSNYDRIPMTSSIEVWDARTLEHVESHSLGIRLGSLTWLDEHGGEWWGTFANYDRPGRMPTGERSPLPYGGTHNTTLVRFGPDWQVSEAWIFPAALLDRFGEMSNSGGSWGPDGELYLTGHDRPEIYRVRLPPAGSLLELEEILPASVRGQGIAWDRSRPGILYGIVRATKDETAAGGTHRVVVIERRTESVGD